MIELFEHQLLWGTLVFARVMTILSTGPFFMISGIPNTVRVTLAIFFTFSILNIVEPQAVSVKFTILSYTIAIAGEVFVGLVIGVMSNYLFAGIQMAGHIIGLDMGFAMSMFFDTTTNANLPILSMFLFYVTFLIYLIIDGHHYLIGAIYYSYQTITFSAWEMTQLTMDHLIHLVGDIFVISIQVASPVFVTLFVTSVGLAFISKVVPQLNIFVVAFQLKIFVGMLMLVAVLPIILLFFKELFIGFERNIFQIIDSMIIR